MATNLALLSSLLLLAPLLLATLKLIAWMWIGAVLTLLAILLAATIARCLILPFADPGLYRLIREPAGVLPSAGKKYRWDK